MAGRAEIRGTATLDTAGWTKGIQAIKNGTRSGAQSVTGIGSVISGAMLRAGLGIVSVGAAVAGVIAWVRSLGAEFQELARQSKALGVPATVLEQLGDVAERSGESAEGFRSKIAKLIDSQEEALNGNKSMAETFERLGISMSELRGLAPDELLRRVAAGAHGSATAISDLNNVMGKGAATEFSATLESIASDGLPSVNKNIEASILLADKWRKKWADIKDAVGDFFAAIPGGLARMSSAKFSAEVDEKSFTQAESNQRRLDELKRASQEKADKQAAKRDALFGAADMAAEKIRSRPVTAPSAATTGQPETPPAAPIPSPAPEPQASPPPPAPAPTFIEPAPAMTSWLDDLKSVISGLFEKARGEATPEIDAAIKKAQAIVKDAEKIGKATADKMAERIDAITVAAPQASDSLARIGGAVGGQTSEMKSVLERQLRVQEVMADMAKEQAQELVRLREKIGELAGE